jgi:hypothetical protein
MWFKLKSDLFFSSHSWKCNRNGKDQANNSQNGTGPPNSQGDWKWDTFKQPNNIGWPDINELNSEPCALDFARFLLRIFKCYKWLKNTLNQKLDTKNNQLRTYMRRNIKPLNTFIS